MDGKSQIEGGGCIEQGLFFVTFLHFFYFHDDW